MENTHQKPLSTGTVIRASAIMPYIIAGLLAAVFFWQFFVRGYIPAPFSYLISWYEPWKSVYSVNGVPTITHKAVADDVVRQIYPMRTLAADIIASGQVPLWNPYNGSGQPLLATLHTGISNPFSVLQLLGHTKGWSFFVIIQLPLLFLATYWYMRTLRLSVFASLLSGFVMTLSGVAAARFVYGDYVYALAGLPILLALIETDALLFVPLVSAFVLVSVQPQISGYIWISAFLYAMIRSRRRMVYVLYLFAGAGLAAFQLIPTLDLYRQANVTSGSSAFIFSKFLMPVSHLITVIIPNYFGNSGTYNFWGRTDYVETVASMGLIPVALAAFAFLFPANGRLSQVKRYMGWAIAVTLLLTLDWVLPRLLYRLPIPVLSTSIPARMYLLATLFIAVLSGIGADRWKATDPKDIKRAVATVGAFILTGIAILGTTAVLAKTGRLSCPVQVPACASVALRNTVFELAVFLCGAAAIVAPYLSKRNRIRDISKVCIIAVIVGPGLYNGWKFLPMSPVRYAEVSHPVISELQRLSPSRIAGTGSGAYATDLATQYRYFDTNYYDPLYIRRYGELVSYANTGSRLRGLTRSDVNIIADATVSGALAFRRERFWDLTGTSALVTKKGEATPCRPADPLSSKQCDALWQDDTWIVMKRETALPRAYLVTDVRTEPDPDRLLAGIFDTKTDLSKTAYTEVPPDGVDIGNAGGNGSAVMTRYEANTMEIRVNAPVSSLLVLSDTYDSGWHAAVDGKETPVYRTDYAFRGIAVPKGEHTVVFTYTPVSFTLGVSISFVSLLVWLSVCWYNRKPKGAVAKW